MKYIYIIIITLFALTACETDLEQVPPIDPEASSLTSFENVLNAAYFYQLGSVTTFGVMGDFRADNAFMSETPYDEWDTYGPDLILMESQFFGPFYTALYRSILSSNIVIENSENSAEVAEAKFLRALSYFKLVRAFGDVTVNLSDSPSVADLTVFARQPASQVYQTVIIPDLQDAIAGLDNSTISSGRASQLAAQSLLGKVYVQMGDFSNASSPLSSAVTAASGAGVSLMSNFAEIFTTDLNSEVIFSTQGSLEVIDEYGETEFWGWFAGQDTKAFNPVENDLIAAFDASPGDLRRAVTVDDTVNESRKYDTSRESDNDWIEIRLADVILLYAETLNENGSTTAALNQLNMIRTRAGLANSTATSQTQVRQAIQDERRLELAFEGHRWFDLVRTGMVDSEMGQSINSNYYVFPIPDSEIQATFGAITQNPGY